MRKVKSENAKVRRHELDRLGVLDFCLLTSAVLTLLVPMSLVRQSMEIELHNDVTTDAG